VVRPRSYRVIYYFDTPALGRRHQSFGRVTNHSVLPTIGTNIYDLTKILNRKKSKVTTTIPELQSKIKTLKSKLQTLKQAQQKDSAMLQHLLSKIKDQSDTKSETED